jgi:drug/metabolite transporter (DMT)-like permease
MFAFAFLLMAIILLAGGKYKELKRLKPKQTLTLILIAVPSYLYYFFYTLSMKRIPAMEASMLNYLFPVMIILFAVPINKEKLTVKKLVSVLTGFVGMLIIVFNGDLSNVRLTNLAGDAMAIAAAVCWGIFSNVAKKNNIGMTVSNFVYTIVAFLISIVTVAIYSDFTAPKGLISAGGLAYAGISNIVLANYIWFRLLKTTSAGAAANIAFITPFISIIFIALLIGESVTLPQTVGFLIIMLSNALQSMNAGGRKNEYKTEVQRNSSIR